MLFCHVTSRVESDPHQDLLRKKGGTGFPYLVFLDADGNVIAKPGGRSVSAFEQTLTGDVKDWFALVERADGGDEAAQAELFVKRVEYGHFDDPIEARALAKSIKGLSDEERQKIDQLLVNQEFNAILGSVTTIEEAADAGRRTLPMWKAGRVPTGDTLKLYYWVFLGKHAEEAKDAEVLGAAIEALEGMRRAPKPMLDEFRAALAEIKKG